MGAATKLIMNSGIQDALPTERSRVSMTTSLSEFVFFLVNSDGSVVGLLMETTVPGCLFVDRRALDQSTQ